MLRRFLAVAAAAAACLAAVLAQEPRAAETVPTSIATLYFARKNFRAGDWVLYRLDEDSRRFGKRTRFQRIQIGVETEFRGEKCFWLETGFGTDPDSLRWSAVLVSEEIYNDPMADVHTIFYQRKLHSGRDINGNPIAMPTRAADARRGIPDMTQYRPKLTEKGNETLRIGDTDYPCRVVEATRNFARLRDLPDSTQRRAVEESSTRWYSPDLVPITAMVRERSWKITRIQTWPIGKPSGDFEQIVDEEIRMSLELLDTGHGAKPKLSDRMKDGVTALQDPEAPLFEPE